MAEKKLQGYQGDQQIQGKRQSKMTEKGREYCLSTMENKRAKLVVNDKNLLEKGKPICKYVKFFSSYMQVY